MCAQKAEVSLAIGKDVTASLHRGSKWVKRLIDSEGRIANSDLASLYFKVPAALVLSGELGSALRNLEWISKHLLGSKGELVVPSGQAQARSYDRGWLVWSASMCGRYDLAFGLAEDLKSFQNPSTGGFWDSEEAKRTGRGTHHAMTVGMAGLGLLSVRCVEEARAAADFLVDLLRRQTDPEGVYLVVKVSDQGEQELASDRNPSDYVDRRASRQRPARLGPAQILLIRLYRLLKDARYLEAARSFTDVFLDGAPGIYDCVEAHKFMWGLHELYQVAPDERLRQAADRISDYIVSQQQPDGQWWGDAIGGGKEGQSLDLRLNTTCNALVGLAYHHHLDGK